MAESVAQIENLVNLAASSRLVVVVVVVVVERIGSLKALEMLHEATTVPF